METNGAGDTTDAVDSPLDSPQDRLSTGRILGYSLPAFGSAMVLISVGVYLPKFYTDELLVGPALLSWVFLLGRFWDAVTDPVMGYVSDRTRTRWGRRRPYFLVSAVPIGVLFYYIWSPATGLSQTGLFVHLLVCYLALYTFWTVFSIPYISLGAEMTMHYHERTRLFGARQAFFVAGTAVGTLAPVYFARHAGDAREGYSMMAAVFGALTMLLIVFAFTRVKENRSHEAPNPLPFFRGLRVTFKNRAFVVLVLVYVTSLVGSSFLAMLTPYIAQYVIHESWVVPYVVLAFMGGSVSSIYLWVQLAKRFGKNKTWSLAMAIGTAGYFLSLTYHEGTWVRWIVLAVIVGAASGCTSAIGNAILADVVDSDELETGKRREGAFFGIMALLDKAAVGLAAFIGLRGLHAIGYQPNVEQTESVIFGMKFLYCLLPAICHLVALILFQRFPITREVHAGIRAELARRAASRRRDADAGTAPAGAVLRPGVTPRS
jgi:sugar (glycoside-pentoside-hexuronide) transporter